jgi:hypothetical protein
VSNERHPDDRQDAANVTLAYVRVGRTSPSRPTPLLQRHPHDRRGLSAVDGLHRNDSAHHDQIRSRSWPFRGLWSASAPERQQATAGTAGTAGTAAVSGSPTPPEAAEHDCKVPIVGVGPGGPGTGPRSPLRPFWPALASRWPHEPEGRALVVTCRKLAPEEVIASVTSASLTKRRPGGHRARRGRRQCITLVSSARPVRNCPHTCII